MKNITTLVAFVFLFAFGHAQNQDSIAITKVIEKFIDAFNQKDLKLYTSLFAEDADFYNWQGAYAHGYQQIQDFHVGVFKRLTTIKLQVLSHSIRFIKPDVAVVVVNEENTDMTSADGKPLPNRIVNLVWVLTKENSNWLIKMNHTAMLNDGSKPSTKN
jgi:uncharacterized protein (TIGR02246 family)